ncbi:kinase-like domain-containing protein [Rhizophagus irregularis DAOM 181602=DAOM 197198]|nr:kinase-like domain-containing protein [Rhizophagus irregularis DAOM 181602=DAOM 197198]
MASIKIKFISKGGFGTTFKAVWKDGDIRGYDDQWKRKGETKVALKCLYNSQEITADFLKEIESNILVYSSGWTVRCFVDSVIYGQVKETDDINKKLLSSIVQSPSSSTSNLLYTTHPQAVYTSRLLDFKNLPESKNVDNDDLEYSVSLKMDFTKLDINSKDEGN